MVSFLAALPYVLYQAWHLSPPGFIPTRKNWCCRWWSPAWRCSSSAWHSRFSCVPDGVTFVNKFAPEGVEVMTDIDKYLSFVMSTFIAFGITFEVPVSSSCW